MGESLRAPFSKQSTTRDFRKEAGAGRPGAGAETAELRTKVGDPESKGRTSRRFCGLLPRFRIGTVPFRGHLSQERVDELDLGCELFRSRVVPDDEIGLFHLFVGRHLSRDPPENIIV